MKAFIRVLKKVMLIIFIVIIVLAGAVYLYMQQPQFGKAPTGERLSRIQQSPNYKDGQFQNQSATPSFTDGANFFTVLGSFLFSKNKNSLPPTTLPSQKTNLLQLDPQQDVLVWFGHSSYFIQLQGKKILVDPVFSGSASPLSFTTKSFKGSDVYTVTDLPPIDYLFISHDHYDHLDYKTILQLQPKVKKIITGLGVGAHLEHWGFDPSIIIEKDWNETVQLEDGFEVHTAPARHFSGRGLKRNGTIWLSFVLQAPGTSIYIGGDSGYDEHFKTIGEKFGPFNLAILESGQYNKSWKYIHLMPQEVVQAAHDLKAKKLMAVHWGKFSLAMHDWNEPIIQVSDISKQTNMPLLTPMIGQAVNLKDTVNTFSNWWQNVR